MPSWIETHLLLSGFGTNLECSDVIWIPLCDGRAQELLPIPESGVVCWAIIPNTRDRFVRFRCVEVKAEIEGGELLGNGNCAPFKRWDALWCFQIALPHDGLFQRARDFVDKYLLIVAIRRSDV
jgi:hypothetical protein